MIAQEISLTSGNDIENIKVVFTAVDFFFVYEAVKVGRHAQANRHRDLVGQWARETRSLQRDAGAAARNQPGQQ